jgi:FixJ family two-component response regulator
VQRDSTRTQDVGGVLIVAVDDDFRVRESIESLFESAGYTSEVFASGIDFLRSGILPQAACVITDVRMPGIDGIELQRRIRETRPVLPVIFISAHVSAEARQLALSGGAIEFLYKPFDGGELLKVVETALSRSS